MSEAITTAVISSDLKASPDQIWTAQALPSTSTLLSSAFKLGQTLGGVEIKVVVETGVTLTAAVTIELQTSATSGGTYVTRVSKTQALGAVAVGDELAGLILPRETEDELYAKILITTTANESAGKVDAYPVFVS